METVLGVQFEPLPKLGLAHLGAFWRTLGGDWPQVDDVPALDQEVERFGRERTWQIGGLQLRLSREAQVRLQIRNRTNDRMIQVQNGRLHYNWLGHSGGEYPRFSKVKPEFDWAKEMFAQFLSRESLGEMQPRQWEVTYVNHLPKGSVWNNPADWRELFPPWSVLPANAARIRLESFGGEWHYEIEPQQGRVHVNVRHGWRKPPKPPDEDSTEEILILTLTARGPIPVDADGVPNLEVGLCIGHETIVRAFKDLTSPAAHQYWELIDDSD